MKVEELINDLMKLPKDATIGITEYKPKTNETCCYSEVDIIKKELVIKPYCTGEVCDYYLE